MELKEFEILEKTTYGIGLKELGNLKTIIYGLIPYVYPLPLNYPPPLQISCLQNFLKV